MHYPPLYPTPTTSPKNDYATLAKNDGADDETVCMSNSKERDDEWTQATEDLTSEEGSDDDSWYIPPTNRIIHPTHVKMPTCLAAWKTIVQANNLHATPHATTIFDVQRVTRSVKHAISDSGATGHFLVENAPATNICPATNPITITLPNGKTIKSTHTCNLDIPWMPSEMTQAHIVPGLAHSSLISTKVFCDAGCKVSFDELECRVYFKNKLMLAGKRDPTTTLWRLPINPTAPPSAVNTVAQQNLQLSTQQQLSHASHLINNVHTLPYLQNQVKYMHQTFFSQPKHTLIKAINNNQLKGIPFMQADLLRKHLARAPAIPKGRMRRPRKGLRSTRRKKKGRRERMQEQEENENELRMKEEAEEEHAGCNNVFCYAALADKQTGTIYTDATGALPHVSLEGNQYYFVAYDYDTNAIFAIPVKD